MSTKAQIVTAQAPAAIGPYSQAVAWEKLVFTSGQIALVPGTKNLVTHSIEEETRQVFQNLEAILEAAGTSFAQVLKVTVFLTDLGNFATVNKVYQEVMPEIYPARSTVQVAALPMGVNVEIDMVAFKM